MIVRHISIIFFVVFVAVLNCSAQISYGGEPASFSNLKSAVAVVPVIEMAPVRNEVLMMEEGLNKDPLKSYQFAKSFLSDISPEKDGVWETHKSVRIWRVGIRSKGAYSLNIIFDKAMIPTGASIFIYTPDKQIVRGAFTANNEQTSGALPIYPLPGEEIIVEYNEPVDASFKGILHISSVNHDYKNAFGSRPLGEAGYCNLDVYCSLASPMKEIKQSVVKLIVDGSELCTGTLVNNVRKDKSPYLLTAGHCIASALKAQNTVFCFNYESPFCGENGSANGSADQSMTGALLRSRSDYLDFALIELENMPPPEFRPYYAGWDNSGTTPTSTTTVHHPKGDVKKIAIDNHPPVIGSYNETKYLKNGFWLIKSWENGTTESGSSGCPLFFGNKFVVGSLTGGTATCSNPTDDYFSMFGMQWNYLSRNDRQLQFWLDPDNTGTTKIEPINPYETFESCEQFSNEMTGEKYLSQKTTDKKGYVSGTNRQAITEYAEKFSQTESTYISSISVSFAKIVAAPNSDSRNIVFNIKSENAKDGLPGETILTKAVQLSKIKSYQTNLIQFDNQVLVSGRYFVTVEIPTENQNDTIAIYHATDRLNVKQNYAYAKLENGWQPFYWIPEIGIKTSLLISVNGCESVPAKDIPVVTNPDGNRFSIYYPNDINLGYVYLVNAGEEEFGTLSFYDMAGRKVSVNERMLTKSPMELSYSNLPGSGIYIFVIETINSKQVLKVRIIKS